MAKALEVHDALIQDAAVANKGIHIGARGEGDSHFIVFSSAVDAVTTAATIQKQLNQVPWATTRPIKVRASIHTGEVNLQLGQYYGTPVNRAARLRGIAHGGQTLISANTWELVKDNLPPGVSVVDRGEHRLRDLTSPEHVYELSISGLANEFPPLLSLDVTRNNLPVQLTDFVGRPEVGTIKRLLTETRLVTILAPGGQGKTRSAIQAAAELTHDFPDGVYFVDLAPIDSPRDIAQTAAEAIGVALTGDDDLETQLLSHLVHKRQLLIFDNFEHVIEGAALVARVLKSGPEVRVLVTSRVKLGITGETVCNLPGLVIEWDTPEEAFEASGVRLFIDAAKRADSLFSLQPAELEPIGRILHLVEGTPLGIILAASWVDTLPVTEIAEEIEKSLDFLEIGQSDHSERHRSMRAVFEYSWRLLDEGERRTFAGLSVFKGGFTREAAEVVVGASLRQLSNLVSKSLIGFDRQSNRYSTHELLRQFAEVELAKDPEASRVAVTGHTRYFADRAESWALEVIRGGEQLKALNALVADLDNMRSALRYACVAGDPGAARSFLLSLNWVYELNGWVKACAEMCAEIRESFEGRDGAMAAVAASLGAGLEAKFLANLGHIEEATSAAVAAVAELRDQGDGLALLVAMEALCEIYSYLEDPDRVLELADEASRISNESGFRLYSAAMAGYRYGAHIQKGDFASASAVLGQEELELLGGGDQVVLGWILHIQATGAAMEGRLEEALSLHSRQVEASRTLGYVRVLAMGLIGLGEIQIGLGDMDAAERNLRDGLDLFERMGFVAEMSYAVLLLARVMSGRGDLARAVEVASCVRADPASRQPYLFQTVTTTELAAEFLDRLSGEMDPATFDGGMLRGAGKRLDIQVKELLTADRAAPTRR